MDEHKGNGAGAPQNKLTQEEIAVIADLDKSLGRMKIELASMVVQIESLNAQKMALVQRVAAQEDSLRGKLNEFLSARGLDPKSQWQFDFATMQFNEHPQA